MEQISGLIGINKGSYSQLELETQKLNLKLLVQIDSALSVRPHTILNEIVEAAKAHKK